MLPIVWRVRARDSLADIVRHISQHNPIAARRIKTLIEEAVLPVAEHPYLFRPGRVPGTREVVAHPNYIVVYLVAAERIEVVHVLHARQQYP
ncbi:MAG TPA: type II toxin-antitoxin system RelE/ParE family toxin [Burkholderiaceae bacterium]|nr:type II toxin-antitoxin system RelE/ParE family toxin [Burkholderiaceae bacterium]